MFARIHGNLSMVMSFMVLLCWVTLNPLDAQEPQPVPAESEQNQWPDEAGAALDLLEIPAGYLKRLVAAEPLVRDPVAFGIDEHGRAYICESARQEEGVEDNRSSAFWLLDDLRLETVDDRLAMYEKHKDRRQGGMDYYSAHDDRLARLIDTDGDGILDSRNLFTAGYNSPLDGTLAGVLVEDGKAWITNIPHLWLATDADDDGVAEQHVSLQRGFGIRIALRGHDMHGLVRGPDGRIYWSIGDRGYHLTTADGRLLADPGAGAVFRCEPDGSDLEVVHVGLRNPQELAFNDQGDLFTGDNNSDAGDRARLVQIVWGGETGWRMEYQTLEGANRRGPWNQEGIWQLDHPVRPVWALAPIAHLTSGPSGFVHYPGTGLPEQNRDCFFLCDFRGTPGSSAVWRFELEQDGAGFELSSPEIFVNKVLCTDVDFTPDGKMWISAWGGGWVSTDRGRLMEVWHPESQEQSQKHRVGHWLTTDLQELKPAQLSSLLGHPDRRVRQRVQFHLAGGTADSIQLLLDAALDGENLRVRRHGIWGVGQWARVNREGSSSAVQTLARLCDDEEAEVREQLARVLGELRGGPISPLIRLLDDPAPRVKFHAALAIGRIGVPEAVERLMEMAAIDGPLDPLLRHAAVMGLAGSANGTDLILRIHDEDREVRLAVLLALRKRGHPGFQFPRRSSDAASVSPQVDPLLHRFLTDEDPEIRTEAARAIHDLPIGESLSSLADQVLSVAAAPVGALEPMGEYRMPFLRRAIDAALRHGDRVHAAGLARLAGRSDVPAEAKREALRALAQWFQPDPRDRVSGKIRPYQGTPRERFEVAPSLQSELLELMHSPGELAGEAQRVASIHGVVLPLEANQRILADDSQQTRFRIQALQQIVSGHPAQAEAGRILARKSGDPHLQVEAEKLDSDRGRRVQALIQLATVGPAMELQQQAIRALGDDLDQPQALDQMRLWLDSLEAGTLAPELALDVIVAASMAGEVALVERAVQLKEGKGEDRLADHQWALVGGHRERGRALFLDHPAAQCQRCHSVGGQGGVAAPALDGVGSRRRADQILRSLVDPSAELVEGYETGTGVSAMPEFHWALSADEIRNIQAYVSGLTD
ncbi:MAG: c-type cytochrome [Planctomycetes bacterium]|jgi:quinoprotein glucose dehydrogenase|nr:c-type cytochrome [Planctomycetota bacterium]MBT6451574.1 c-type cytochrome [Planctomycetota bacterium]MBT6541082.1 c-type cytochrome [Planctomycetota bacterium]MBT6967170.1 c-type cytochrome [Planctomycetota bacterium]MBT7103718.1 c-type cytochrome [Planctomycetota bacterium]